MGYLSNAGLSYFFGKLKTIFAPISHGHGGATQSEAGFMSAADKKKLDGIAEGANKYSLPTATSSVLGGVKTGANITNNSGVLSVTAANVTNALGYTPPKQDTNTWRPVVNSLTSSATDQSLAANQGKILNESKAAMIVLTNENLNDVVTPGFYSSGGSNSVTNKPSNVDHFGLIVIHRASGNYYTQIIYGDSAAYRRHCANGTWSGWVQDKLTDTDTWRGIQNNLTSDSTTDSLSAAQGKALKALVDGKAAMGHTHNSIKDIGNMSSDITFSYSKAGMSYTDYTWLAGWNGYELRAVNKDQFATAGHTHTKAQVGLDNVDNTADANKSVKYATKAANADVAIGVADYNTPSKTIKIGYNGDGITGDAIKYIAGYTTGDGGSTTAKIKDVSKSALQSWLGLGNAAYTASSAYASSNHTHDDRYYTESEIDSKLSGKANNHSHPYLPLAGGTMSGTITFAAIGDKGTSAGLAFSGSTDGAGIYYQTTAGDQGNLVLNLTDDENCYLQIAKNGAFKSYFSPDGVFHGSVAGNASSASSVAWSNVTGKPSTFTPASHTHTKSQITDFPALGTAAAKNVRTLTAQGASGWNDVATDQQYVPDMSFIAYWNGAYSGTSSNLTYCNRGAFGTIVTKNTSDYAVAGHTHNYAGSSSAGGAATSANKVNAALTINLNGTSQGAWDGSSAKSISITAASVGATSVIISRW